jgi:hypothetical protein
VCGGTRPGRAVEARLFGAVQVVGEDRSVAEYRLGRGGGVRITTRCLKNSGERSGNECGGDSVKLQQPADIPSANGREEEKSER